MVDTNEQFKSLYTSSKRYFLITGGRASLKSTTVHDFIARLTFETGHGILFTRYTMTSAHKSIIPEFEIILNRLGIRDLFYITKSKIINLQTGSFILFSGIKTSSGDQTANLKSLSGITTWVIEEGEDFNNDRAFDIIDDSIRSNQRQNRVIWIQNPTTKEHFIYKRWIDPNNTEVEIKGHRVIVSNMDEVEHIHVTYHLAERLGYLSQGWVNKANRVKTENPKFYYHNYIGGWLSKAEGVVYDNWERGQWDKSLSWCFGLDFGFHPDETAMCKVAVDHKKKILYLEEVLYKKELSTDGMIKAIKRIARDTDLIIGDNSEKRLIHDLRNKGGFNIHPCVKGAGSIKKGINDILSYKMIVCGESQNLVRELSNYVWNDRKSGVPNDAMNHLCDAFRYGFDRMSRKKIFVG
jgi:phage terminase large subunit